MDGSDAKQLVISVLKPMARALVETFPPCEVVIHDFADLEHSIIWIEGNITGRQGGGSLTDLGLAKLRAEDVEDEINYITHTEDGRILKSTSCFLRYPDGEIFGALCVNVDVTTQLAFEMLLRKSLAPQSSPLVEETFSDDARETVDAMIAELTYEMGRPVNLMSKGDRVHLVGKLEERGAFRLRRGVPMVAATLGVSRHTIYNYINELRENEKVKER